MHKFQPTFKGVDENSSLNLEKYPLKTPGSDEKRRHLLSSNDESDSLGKTSSNGEDNLSTARGDDAPFFDILGSSLFVDVADGMLHLACKVAERLQKRSFYYVVASIILTLLTFGQGTSAKYSGVKPRSWYKFLAIVIGVDSAATVVDESLLYLFEALWFGPTEFVLYSNCLKGPLSCIITLSVINSFLVDMEVPQSLDYWDPLMTTVLSIWTLYTIRKFYQRMNLNRMMFNKFNDRLLEMEIQSNVLSLLACYTPRLMTQGDSRIPLNYTSSSQLQLNAASLEKVQKDLNPEKDHHITRKQRAMSILRKSSFGSKLKEQIEIQRNVREDLNTIFSGIVQASAQAESSNANSSLPAGATAAVPGDTEKKRKTTFWDRVHYASKRVLQVTTINGVLTIAKRVHAQSFSKKLYVLLSHSGRRALTGKRLTDMLRKTLKEIQTQVFSMPQPPPGASQLYSFPNFIRENDDEWIIQKAHKMLHIDDSQKTILTADNVNSICQELYMAHKNASKSLDDFGEVNRSLTAVMDGVFWVVMFLLAQIILQIDTMDVFAPLLTVVFGLSFAVGPMVGNACMSIGYVLYMLSYDVGERIAIGEGTSKIIGDVYRISLLQTTIRSIYNEIIQIPNHVLFSSKIINLTKSTNAVFEIPVSFSVNGPSAVSQVKLDAFWKKVEDHVAEEKDIWKDSFVTAHTLRAETNTLGYSLWVFSRFRFVDIDDLYSSRRYLIEKLVQIQKECGIDYMSVSQPIDIVGGNAEEFARGLQNRSEKS